MRLCLVEDNAVSALEPLTLTRPAFDLLLGSSPLGIKLARAFGVGPGPARRGAIVRPFLAAVCRSRDPKTVFNDPDWLARGPVLVANGRWVPAAGFDGAALFDGVVEAAHQRASVCYPGQVVRVCLLPRLGQVREIADQVKQPRADPEDRERCKQRGGAVVDPAGPAGAGTEQALTVQHEDSDRCEQDDERPGSCPLRALPPQLDRRRVVLAARLGLPLPFLLLPELKDLVEGLEDVVVAVLTRAIALCSFQDVLGLRL